MKLSDWSAADAAAALSGSGRAKAKKTGRGWMVCCPAHDDRTPSLSLSDGRKDILLYHCFGGCSDEMVKNALEHALGVDTTTVAPTPRKRPRKKIKDSVETITPVPEDRQDVTLEDFYHFEYGAPTKVWTYRLPDNRVANWIARYDLKDGDKEVIPWSWTRDTESGKEELRMKGIPTKRPLYNLDRIMADPNAPVLWCEGEKAADAGQKLFPKWVTTATQGGTSSISCSNLTPLHGRTVIMMPDHDRAGSSAAANMLSLIGHKCRLHQIVWPRHWPLGDDYEIREQDDAADHLERGWDAETLRLMVSNGHKLTYRVKEIAPSFHLRHYDWEAEQRFRT